MKKRTKLLLTLMVIVASVLALAMVASAEEYTVTSADEFNTAYSQAVDGDTIIITQSLSATLNFGKSITYILDGDGVVWKAGANNDNTGKTIKILSKNGDNSFSPNATMWCNSYGLTVKDLSTTNWILGAEDRDSTLLFDMTVANNRLFYGTFLNEITFLPGTIFTNLTSTTSSGDTNFLKCTTLNIYENVKIYGNTAARQLIDVTTLNMYGGEIKGNKTSMINGGVLAGTLNMYGGEISNNFHTYTNPNYSVSFLNITKGGLNIYGGEIHNNYAIYGCSQTAGAIGANGNYSVQNLYVIDGKIYDNYVVDSMTVSKNEATGYYEATDIVINENTKQYQDDRFSAKNFKYAVIFREENSRVINAYMVNEDGTILKSVDGSTEITIPSNSSVWTTKMYYCELTQVDTTKAGNYYMPVDHTYEGLNDCTDPNPCVECAFKPEAKLSHTIVETLAYNDGYLAFGYYTCDCTNDGCTINDIVDEEYLPIFVINGYSSTQGAIMQSFQINRDVFAKYTSLNENVDIKYGILAASGNVVNIYTGVFTDSVVSVDFTNRAYDIMEMKIYGIGEAHYATELYCCGYILVDGAITYMDYGMASGATMPTKVTYNSIAEQNVTQASLDVALPTSKEQNV